ncbi:MAG TPA: amidohydrolase [Solirubrobacterales bacterium]|nr:amidohydrolase [Solirubrobacterales bacterium]
MSETGGDLCVVNALIDGEIAGLRAEGGLVAEVGPAVRARPGEAVLDAGGAILSPPLINGHTHAAMTLFRGHGDDLPLMRWLQEAIWPVEARLEDEDVYWGTRLACLEMIRTGTTKFWDMYWQPDAVARAVRDAGIRAVVGPPMIDPKSDSDLAGRNDELLGQLASLGGYGPRIEAAVAPHSIYTVSTESLEFAFSVAKDMGLPVHIHLSETEPEVEDCLSQFGVRPARYLDSLGLVTPETVLAHGVWLDDEELELIAARGATVATNPVANMKLAVGNAFPYPAARRAGVRLALGTDGAGSNNSLDLLADLKVFALLQRHHSASAEAIPVCEAWAIATGRRSDLVGDPTPLTVGGAADFLLLDGDSHELALGDLTSSLVYSASGAVVRTTVVDGRVLMENRRVEGATEVVARARERAQSLGLG